MAEEEALLAPAWARAMLGAGATTLVGGAYFELSKLMPPPPPGGMAPEEVMLALALALVFGAAISTIADLDRLKPRIETALVFGGVLAVSVLFARAIHPMAVALAPALPLALRAFMSGPAGGRIERAIQWAFAGALACALAAIATGLAFLAQQQTAPPGFSGLTMKTRIAATASLAFVGAILTLSVVAIDRSPEEEPAPALTGKTGGIPSPGRR